MKMSMKVANGVFLAALTGGLALGVAGSTSPSPRSGSSRPTSALVQFKLRDKIAATNTTITGTVGCSAVVNGNIVAGNSHDFMTMTDSNGYFDTTCEFTSNEGNFEFRAMNANSTTFKCTATIQGGVNRVFTGNIDNGSSLNCP